jgi:predicted Zn-dependent protease
MEQIEALLAEDPNDAFLRYGLAMEYASLGDDATAATKLLELTQSTPYVPAFLQAGQMLAKLNRETEAMEVLRRGMLAAQKQNDQHAYGEMQGLLMSLE